MIPIANDYAVASAPILARMVAADMPPPMPSPADAGPGAATSADSGADAVATGAIATTSRPTGTGTGAGAADGGTGTAVATARDALPRPEALAGFMHTVFLGVPIGTALLGILGSLLLIAYFGGRRGRVLYGLEAAPPARR